MLAHSPFRMHEDIVSVLVVIEKINFSTYYQCKSSSIQTSVFTSALIAPNTSSRNKSRGFKNSQGQKGDGNE